MSDHLVTLLEQGFARTRKQNFIVAGITLGLAVFLTALYWLDAEVAYYGTGMKVLFFVVTIFFYGIGAMMLQAGLKKVAQQQAELLQSLQTNPALIRKAYYYRVVSKAAKNAGGNPPVGAQHYVRIEYTSGKMVQISYPYNQISPVLNEIYKRAPHTKPVAG